MKIVDDYVPTPYDGEPKEITGNTLKGIYTYNRDLGGIATIQRAVEDYGQTISMIPDGGRIWYGQTQIALSDLLGKETLKKSGELNIQTASRNLQLAKKEYEQKKIDISEEELNSWTYSMASAGTNYAPMIGLGLVTGGAGSIAYMSALKASGEAIEGLEAYQKENPEDYELKGFTNRSNRELAFNTANTITEGVLEKTIGIGKQLNIFKGAKDYLITFGKGFASEFATEEAQEKVDSIYDWFNDRIGSKDELTDRWKSSFKNSISAGIFGGSAGASFAVYNKSQSIKATKDLIKNVVPAKDVDMVANSVYENGVNNLTDVMSKELELSSELRANHGEIYDSMITSINKQIKESGAFTDYTEDMIAQYTSDTAKLFADQVLAESNKRGVFITEVLQSANIKYENGKLFLDSPTLKTTISEELYQPVKGKYIPSLKAIEITKKADFSTYPHELGHFWLDNMWEYSRSGNASENYLNTFKAVKNWLDIKDNQVYLSRKQQEKFARGYEKYLFNGNLPSPMIKGAFDDYDKWLNQVYQTAKELRVDLSPEAIDFFKTTTTGEFLEPTKPSIKSIEDNNKRIEKSQEETKEVIIENKTLINEIPKAELPVVDTTSEKAESSLQKRYAEVMGLDKTLEYDVASNKEQIELSKKLVSENPQKALDIINRKEKLPDNMLRNSLINAYMDYSLSIGDNTSFLDILERQSLESTRLGQEIQILSTQTNKIQDVSYWINYVENNRKNILAEKAVGYLEGFGKKSPLELLDDKINKTIDTAINEVLKLKTVEEQQNKVKEIADKLVKDLGVKEPKELFQLEEELKDKSNAYIYVAKTIKDRLGISLQEAEKSSILQKAESLEKSLKETLGKDGNPSVLYFKNMAELEDYANSLTPSPILSVLTSTIGRGNMLASIKSPLLNIESNTVTFVTEMITRRLVNGIQGKSTTSLVDNKLINDYKDKHNQVYKQSGYIMSKMDDLQTRKRILGETILTSQGDGLTRKIGRFYENTIFKYGLGYMDAVQSAWTFTDVASLEATSQAKKEGKGKDRANELFMDSILVEPQTDLGKLIRDKAVNYANIATYTNNTVLSELTTKLRGAINKATGRVRLGDLISPFVKTPANVVALSFDYGLGGLKAVKNFTSIINDFKTGDITPKTQKSIEGLSRNMLGILASILIGSVIDDEEYIPDYEMLSPSERELVKQKNGAFNSIKVGNKYISLDFLGGLASPLIAVLEFNRGKDFSDSLVRAGKGFAQQFLKLPVIADLKEIYKESSQKITQRDNTKIIDGFAETFADFTISRLIPSIINDVAKTFDSYERETNRQIIDKIESKLPVIREDLPTKKSITTGRAFETEATQILFGARVKTSIDNSVIREIDKLFKKDEKPSLSDITRYGKFKDLTPEKKNIARDIFAREYSKGAKELISTNKYKTSTSEEKKKLLNKVRESATKKAKERLKL